jgi:flagellar hook-associated protein 3 FlgL
MNRVSTYGLNQSILSANQETLARIATYQKQLATGKRIEQVSDDPVAAKLALRYRTQSLASQKYLDNIDKAQAFMGASESALANMTSTLDQVKQAAVQGANGTQDAASRKALAQNVDSLLTRMVDLANTVHDGRYVFAGTATGTKPFALAAGGGRVDYQGDLDTFSVQVGPDSSVQVDQNGHAMFKADVDVFDALITLRDALESGDRGTVESLLPTIDAATNHINELQGGMGGRQQRIELTKGQLENSRVFLNGLVSSAEDADLTDTISKLQLSQVALEAGLQSGARVLQPTLLDFLR